MISDTESNIITEDGVILCPDPTLNSLILQRMGMVNQLRGIRITNKKKQPKRYARWKRLRRALRAADRAIADRCQEIFTP